MAPRPYPSTTSNPDTATKQPAREPDTGSGSDDELDRINKILAQAAAEDIPT